MGAAATPTGIVGQADPARSCQPGWVPDAPLLILLVAAALHLGFQLTVTTLVYPAFAEVPTQQWRAHHDRHSRRIAPVVIVVYGLLLVACGWVLLVQPGVLTVAAVGACVLAGGLTATVAAPAHGRLGSGRDRRTLQRLLLADRLRLAAAAVALACALAACFPG